LLVRVVFRSYRHAAEYIRIFALRTVRPLVHDM